MAPRKIRSRLTDQFSVLLVTLIYEPVGLYIIDGQMKINSPISLLASLYLRNFAHVAGKEHAPNNVLFCDILSQDPH